ncbi:hypothetical protein M0R72_01560 [Candidatus Pacearchaeota archaeon]|jgi:hypothetical protein|nr:hypothetical protein [Candidatus Pacearchaeota archaeon]
MMEAGVLLGPNNSVIHWHTPNARSGGSLPDSVDLWQIIWENCAIVSGFAHTHPGSGVPGPSHTDITTFIAVEKGLGKHLNWFILSSDSQALCLFDNEMGELPSGIITVELYVENTTKMTWMSKLRELSHY